MGDVIDRAVAPALEGGFDGRPDGQGDRPVVLVVDDEPQILLAVSDALEEFCEVLTATGGAEALEILGERRDVAVVVTDQRMPAMQGDEFLKRARGLSPAVAIMATGYSDIEAVVSAVNHGALFGYVAKPWRVTEFQALVTSAIRHYYLQRELSRERVLFHQLLDNVPDAIFFIDAEQRLVHANGAFAALCEQPSQYVLPGKPLAEVLPAGLVQSITQGNASAIATAQVQAGELIGYQCGGVQTWLSATRAPLVDEAGAVTGLVGIARDVTRMLHDQHELKLRGQAIEACADGVLMAERVDGELRTVYLNRAMERISGYRAEALRGRSPWLLCGADLGQPGLELLRIAVRQEAPVTAELRCWRGDDGAAYAAELRLEPVQDDRGQCSHVVMVFQDVTERQHHRRSLERHAQYEPLTGLANRSLAMDRIAQAAALSARSARHAALLCVGVDGFVRADGEPVPGSLDRLLQATARRLEGCVASGDTVAQVGEGEFLLVVGGIAAPEDGRALADTVRAAFAEPLVLEDGDARAQLSLGMACCMEADAETSFRQARSAMLEARASGDGVRVRLAPQAGVEADDDPLKTLERALEQGELTLHYQPQVSFSERRAVALEALLRWRSPDAGLIEPEGLLPLAEDRGLMTRVGGWVLGEVCRQVREWLDAGVPVPRVVINLSHGELGDDAFAARLVAELERRSLTGAHIGFEIDEETARRLLDRNSELVATFRVRGIAVTLDNFGSGHASLLDLKRLHFIDGLKVDRAFVREVISSPTDAAMYRAICGLAAGLRLKVIAKGVETEAQARYLRRNDVDQMQGFYFSAAVPADEVPGLLRDGRLAARCGAATTEPVPTVLLVDDEAPILGALRRLLRGQAYRVLTAGSGAEALELMAREEVQVVVSDYRMHGMNGVEFLARARALHPGCERILLTAYTDFDTVVDAINRGMILKCLAKPWNDEELIDTVRQGLEQQRRRAAGKGDTP